MFSSLSRKFGTVPTKVNGSSAQPRRSRLELEALEGRQLLSLGSEFLANTKTVNNQFDTDTASAANGLSVIVWTDVASSTDRDIRAQMFTASGLRLGPEILVEGSLNVADSPSVAMDSSGDFVVVWQQSVNNQLDIKGQRFDSSGAKLGGIFTVVGSAKNESDPDVAMDASGNFVVSYTLQFDRTDQDVVARQFNSSGAFLREIFVAASSIDELNSSVAMSPDGRFDVAYQTEDASLNENVRLNRYGASGNLLSNLSIATTSARENSPSVSMDDFGDAVVVYQKFVGNDFDVKAKRVFNTGFVGNEINVRNTLADETAPKVALRRDGSSFVVAYNSTSPGFAPTVQVTEVNSLDTVVAQINPGGNNNQAALSIDASGNYVLSYTAISSTNDRDIHFRRGHLS